jgi:uncharacterized membrane protein YcaP (DUF421 family)
MINSTILLDGYQGLLRILIIAPFAYASIILFLRIAGKRTLTKLNAFDLVITVALGSTLATQILSRDVPLADGVLTFAVLIGLQWLVAFSSVHSKFIRDLVRAEPALLASDGELHERTLRRERVTPDEVLQVVRAEGGQSIEDAKVVYLQTDGSFAVIMRSDGTS